MIEIKKLLMVAGAAVIFCGCAAPQAPVQPRRRPVVPPPPPVKVLKISEKITPDGKLDEKVWQKAPLYELKLVDSYRYYPPFEYARIRKDPYESARFRMVYDENHLYLGVEVDDSDVVCFEKKDQRDFYRNSDLIELFLWPEELSCYWELYATPSGLKTSIFYPAGGLSMLQYRDRSPLMPGFKVFSTVQGTLNDHRDKDKGWRTEICVPLKVLAAQGVPFKPGTKWRVLVGRYNFSKNLWKMQNSWFPVLPAFNFHYRSYYSPVEFK